MTEQRSTPEIAAHADAALRAVRVILAVLSGFLVISYRPLVGEPVGSDLAITLTIIVASTLFLNYGLSRLPRRDPWTGVTQTADVAAIVALTIALDGPLGGNAWVLLVVPIVSAAVRHGALASLVTWVAGTLGFIGAALSGAVDFEIEITLLARIPGLLLAVAITVAVLARWMREGWEIQNSLTNSVFDREHRLEVIEQTARALNGLAPDDALALCASQIVKLGFDACTVVNDVGDVIHTFGDGRLISIGVQAPEVGDRPVATVWMGKRDIEVYSVSVRESHTSTVIVGWSASPLTTDHANALTNLVGHASTAIETSHLLRQLQHASGHDPLTGLLNRRGLDDAIERALGTSTSMAVAFMDLDNLKAINDEHGHQIGDKAIVAVARRIESACATVDAIIARYGGDEFVVVVPNGNLEQIRKIGIAAITASQQAVVFGPLQLLIGMSAGIAAGKAPFDERVLLRRADQAVYEAKAAGKGALFEADPSGAFIAVHAAATAPELRPAQAVTRIELG